MKSSGEIKRGGAAKVPLSTMSNVLYSSVEMNRGDAPRRMSSPASNKIAIITTNCQVVGQVLLAGYRLVQVIVIAQVGDPEATAAQDRRQFIFFDAVARRQGMEVVSHGLSSRYFQFSNYSYPLFISLDAVKVSLRDNVCYWIPAFAGMTNKFLDHFAQDFTDKGLLSWTGCSEI